MARGAGVLLAHQLSSLGLGALCSGVSSIKIKSTDVRDVVDSIFLIHVLFIGS